jgi:hypothetical protein
MFYSERTSEYAHPIIFIRRVFMSTSPESLSRTRLPMLGIVLALSALTLIGGCVVETPPPRRVYVAPPPPPPPPPPPAATYEQPGVNVDVQASEPPPPLPDYDQPAPPDEGYLWTPGYWGWGGGGYYWVPGTWVQPPRVGFLWTPGYWGFVGGIYAFHVGYWGPHVGFYGGVNYGFGYGGVGFVGGRWAGNTFAYNRSVTNVNVTNVHNTYNETVINNVTVNKVSYNGGAGGVAAAPTAQERVAAQEQHVAPTPAQRQHVQQAASTPALAARANGGHPAIAATPRPAAFTAPGVMGARGAAPAPRGPNAQPQNTQGNNAVHPGQPAVQSQRPQTTAPRPPAPTAKPAPQKPQGKPAPRNEKRDEGGNR